MTQTGIEPWTSQSAVCLYPPDHTQYLMDKSYTVYKVETLSVQLINPRRRTCAVRVTVVVLHVSYHVFCHHMQQTGQKATPTGSTLHWLHFKTGDFRKSTAFKSYGVKKPIC